MVIGNLSLENNIFLAPMAGITDPPLRSLSMEFGCTLGFSEMVSANGLVRRSERSLNYLRKLPDESLFAAQIFGSDPEVLADAARISEGAGVQLIDINMGCPVKKVLKTGSGAALMKDPEKIKKILKKVRGSISVPLTIKLRAGWKSDINAPLIAAIAQDEGVSAVILHPRTVEQAFSGRADWGLIKRLKQTVQVPVIGNGDVTSALDAAAMLEETGCDGIMIGRGAIGYPWIFREIAYYQKTATIPAGPGPAERKWAVERHWQKTLSFYHSRALRLFKIRLPWYTKGLRGAAAFRREIFDCHEAEHLLARCREYFDSLECDPK